MVRALDFGETTSWWLHPRSGVATGMSLACLALLPFGGLYNVPLLALCGLGLLCLASRPREALGNDGLRLLLVLFLCFWLPMTISAVDAVNPVDAWRKVGSFLVLFLAGAYMAMALRRRVDLQRLLVGVSIVCVFWGVDASWQFMHGFNLLGDPYEGGRVPGIFYPDLKLGIVLVTLSPFVFEAKRRLAGRCAWVLLALVPFFAAIALSGSRSSWIVLLVVLGGYGWYLFRWAEAPARGRAVLRVAVVGVFACGMLAGSFPEAAGQMKGLLVERVAPVVDFVRDDFQTSESTTEPIRARLTFWESAARVFRNHWLNGVGPRGFRKVHPDHAPAHDVHVQRGQTSNYPHLVVFEIAAETGVIGLLGYLAALVVLVRRFLDMNRTKLAHGFPYLLAGVVALFPFATHLAFYSHFMGVLIWWTIAVSVAGLCVSDRCEPGEETG